MGTGLSCHYCLHILLPFHVKTWISRGFLFITQLSCYRDPHIGAIPTPLNVQMWQVLVKLSIVNPLTGITPFSVLFVTSTLPGLHHIPMYSMNDIAFMRLNPWFEVLFCTYSKHWVYHDTLYLSFPYIFVFPFSKPSSILIAVIYIKEYTLLILSWHFHVDTTTHPFIHPNDFAMKWNSKKNSWVITR